jgi:hypothetical protein
MAGEAMGGCDLDELEDHLRDGIDARVARGFSAEEAFVVARHDLGSGVALEAEFGKINRSRTRSRRLLWMIAGYLGINFLISLIDLLQAAAGLIAIYFGGVGVQVASWSAIVISLLGYGLLMTLIMIGVRGKLRIPAPMSRALRDSPGLALSTGLLAILGLWPLRSLVFMWFARFVNPADFGQLTLSLAWFNLAMTMLVPLALCLMLFAAYRQSLRSRSAV